ALEVRPQFVGPPFRGGSLPCQRRCRVEHVEPAHVVVARAFDQVVYDVKAVDPAREQRPSERRPEREQVVGFCTSRVRLSDPLGGRRTIKKKRNSTTLGPTVNY